MIKQAHLYICGDVIGIGFRIWTKNQAALIGVKGWVRNVYDQPKIFGPAGGVETVIQGEEKKIKQMVELFQKGPLSTGIKDIKITWEKPQKIFNHFEIIK